MKKSKRYLLSAFGLALLGGLLTALDFILYKTTGNYPSNKTLMWVGLGCLIGAVAVLTVGRLVSGKACYAPKNETLPGKIVALVGVLPLWFYFMMKGESKLENAVTFTLYALLVYEVAKFSNAPKFALVKQIFALVGSLFAPLTVAWLYIDYTVEMNAPVKLFAEAVLILLFFTFIYRLYVAVGIDKRKSDVLFALLFTVASLGLSPALVVDALQNADHQLYGVLGICVLGYGVSNLLRFVLAEKEV